MLPNMLFNYILGYYTSYILGLTNRSSNIWKINLGSASIEIHIIKIKEKNAQYK